MSQAKNFTKKVFAKVIHGANRVPQLAVDGNIFSGLCYQRHFFMS